MRFGIGFGQDIPITETAHFTRLSEEAGFEHATFIDLGNLSAEVHVALAVAAQATERIRIGHGVTDPVTYHPAAIANAIATVRDLAGERVFAGLGTGGDYGKPYLRSPKVAEMHEAIRFIKDYTAGEDATFDGHTWHNEWIRRSRFAGERVPVLIAVSGPRMCVTSGQVADGVFSLGMDVDLQGWRKALVDRGAREAGRDPDELEFWVRGQIYLTDDRDSAFAELAPYAAVCAWEFWKVLKRKTPETLELADLLESAHPGILAEFQAIYENWDPYWTERIGGRQTEFVTDRMVDFFTARGTPAEVMEKLGEFEQLGIAGVSTVAFAIQELEDMIGAISDGLVRQTA